MTAELAAKHAPKLSDLDRGQEIFRDIFEWCPNLLTEKLGYLPEQTAYALEIISCIKEKPEYQDSNPSEYSYRPLSSSSPRIAAISYPADEVFYLTAKGVSVGYLMRQRENLVFNEEGFEERKSFNEPFGSGTADSRLTVAKIVAINCELLEDARAKELLVPTLIELTHLDAEPRLRKAGKWSNFLSLIGKATTYDLPKEQKPIDQEEASSGKRIDVLVRAPGARAIREGWAYCTQWSDKNGRYAIYGRIANIPQAA